MSNDSHKKPVLKVPNGSSKLRRMVAWLAFTALIVMLQLCYLSSYKNFEFVKNTFGALESFKRNRESNTGALHILVVAYARTGSSFIGDLIQTLPNSFYHFEPIHFLSIGLLNNRFEEARNLLGNLFTCKISQIEDFLPWQEQHIRYKKLPRNVRYWKDCSRMQTCYNGTYMDSYCHNQTTVIAKTIRINLREASKLFTSHPDLNLKLIYLARDARGTMNSRTEKNIAPWCELDPMCINPIHFCANLKDDVKLTCSLLANRPNNFMVIRYEDVATNPHDVASQIVKFLGLPSVPGQMKKFLESHTSFRGNPRRMSKAEGLDYPYTTIRNSSATAMSWRKELPFRAVRILQKHCKEFLSAFGFHSYKSSISLRYNADLNVDLASALASTCNTSFT